MKITQWGPGSLTLWFLNNSVLDQGVHGKNVSVIKQNFGSQIK